MNRDLNEQINLILIEKKIDERVKPFIKLYFQGKASLGNLSLEELQAQIDTLCNRISNMEFSTNNLVTAYSNKSNVLTINKQLCLAGKTDEVILPVFMKFEEVLNNCDRKAFANHIENFINAGRIATSLSVPISDRLYKLYEISEYTYGEIEDIVDKLVEDSAWQGTCLQFNKALNKSIITGIDDKEILNAANLFHARVFTAENLTNPNFRRSF